MSQERRSPRRLYGRGRELSKARPALERALTGHGGVLLLTGEPGIGKSSLAQHLAGEAAQAGATVVWGRCWEAGGAPAYWPWIQIFRALQLDGQPFESEARDATVSAEAARFQAFDLAVRRLKERAQRTPLALVIDDLQAADLPSLLLLLMLARALKSSPIFVLGTCREAEMHAAPEVGPLLAKLARDAELVPVGRLTPEDVTAWLADDEPGADEARGAELYRLTEGHPLFVVEALRLGRRPLVGDLAMVLDERLAGLEPATRVLLEVAAVLGRELSAAEVAIVADVPLDEVHARLGEACAASIVLPVDDGGRFRFSHMLLRDRLYFALQPSRRTALHWQVGTSKLAAGAEPLAIARHLLEGHDGDGARAGHAAAMTLRAAQAALDKLAFEEAAGLAARALDIAAKVSPLAAELHLVAAEAWLRLGELTRGKDSALEAAALARQLGNPELLARAALVYGTVFATGTVDPAMVALLREALARLPDGSSAARARLMARLASALMPPRSEDALAEIRGLLLASTAMASALGDEATRLYVLQFAAVTAVSIVSEDERFDLLREVVTLARARGRRLLLVELEAAYVASLLGRGLRAEAEAALAPYEALLAEPAHRLQRWRAPLLRVIFALHAGDFAAAERESARAGALAEEAGSRPGLRLWASQRVQIAVMSGRIDAVRADAPKLSAILESMTGAPFAAWLLAVSGRRDEARRWLRSGDVNLSFYPALVLAAETCVLTEDVELAQTLYGPLSRIAGRMMWSGAWVIGPTSRTLGDVALLLGHREEALRHYDEAIALGERIGAPGVVEPCRRLRAVASEEEATRRTREAPKVAPVPPPAKGLALTRDGDVWSIDSPSGRKVRIRHTKGLGYLCLLLERPDCEVHVFELVGIDHAAGDAGPVLDARAKAEYRARIDALNDSLGEAERYGDMARARRTRDEIDALYGQLAGALGLGGRDRRASSDVERARINVQRRLKSAVDNIARVDAALGRYLTAAVTTGIYCAYRPL